jgi:hypothetical protein
MIHKRMPEIVNLPISKIPVDPNAGSDKQFIQLYQQVLLGKLYTAITRLPIDQIASGYYDFRNGSAVNIMKIESENVLTMKRAIRTGWRPELLLYWSPLAPNGGGYVCSDDQAALAAYAKLKFLLVPARIMRPSNIDAPEAAFWLEARGQRVALHRTVAPVISKYPSLMGVSLPSFSEVVSVLVEKCHETRQAIIALHENRKSGTHYHQMLHAFLLRHQRLLDSISRLVALGRVEHAEALTRVGYEAFLNFYIDWLSPEFFGPRLQLLAAVRASQNQGGDIRNEGLAALDNFVEFLENTSSKGRISPLGSFFHNLIYPPLCRVAHQSYSHLEQEASEFNVDDPPMPASRTDQLARWIDVLTAALVLRVENDVGVGTRHDVVDNA